MPFVTGVYLGQSEAAVKPPDGEPDADDPAEDGEDEVEVEDEEEGYGREELWYRPVVICLSYDL